MAKAIIFLMHFYRAVISPLFPPSCRFYPSCSQYLIDAFSKYSLRKAFWLSLRRLFRCHPFRPGGYDPVD